jgi:repressor LexA
VAAHRRDGPTPRDYDVLDYYQSFHRRKGYWPSIRDVMKALGMKSPRAVQSHLEGLVRLGYMRNTDGHHIPVRRHHERPA